MLDDAFSQGGSIMYREGGVMRLRGGKVGGVKAKDLWDKVGAAPDARSHNSPQASWQSTRGLGFLDGEL